MTKEEAFKACITRCEINTGLIFGRRRGNVVIDKIGNIMCIVGEWEELNAMKEAFGSGITARRNRSDIDPGKLTLLISGTEGVLILEELLPLITHTEVYKFAYDVYFAATQTYRMPRNHKRSLCKIR